ncbi:hypothetical protein BCVP_CDS0107 [Bacillus phage BC-VP]|nr:hypothetical protein BCVP_CDS0107 [Bacillus phage BC-VP]
MILYLQLWWAADGTEDYGKAIRWLYLFGVISESRLAKLDKRNYKKWSKRSSKSFDDYLNVARV